MKSKTNISVVSNTGTRRKAEVIIGDNGKYPSGDILDANAVELLVTSGGGEGGGAMESTIIRNYSEVKEERDDRFGWFLETNKDYCVLEPLDGDITLYLPRVLELDNCRIRVYVNGGQDNEISISMYSLLWLDYIYFDDMTVTVTDSADVIFDFSFNGLRWICTISYIQNEDHINRTETFVSKPINIDPSN